MFCLPSIISAVDSYSNCPTVWVAVPGVSADLGNRSIHCDGTLLRISRKGKIPGVPASNGRKYFSLRTSKFDCLTNYTFLIRTPCFGAEAECS